uniref:Uncharacterized protein n=1 Tax=Panagrellus redivivus TaxID=6233 RepID=A0A7E4W3B9_PANRE
MEFGPSGRSPAESVKCHDSGVYDIFSAVHPTQVYLTRLTKTAEVEDFPGAADYLELPEKANEASVKLYRGMVKLLLSLTVIALSV